MIIYLTCLYNIFILVHVLAGKPNSKHDTSDGEPDSELTLSQYWLPFHVHRGISPSVSKSIEDTE